MSGSPPASKAVTSGVSSSTTTRAREGEAVGPRKVTDRSHALEVEGPVRFARAGGAGRQDRNVCAARCGSGEGARDEGQFGATVPPVAADDDDRARLSHPEARAVLPTGVGGAAPPLATASLPRRRNQRCPRSPCRARRCGRREDRIGLRWHRWPPPVHSGGGDPIGPKFFQPTARRRPPGRAFPACPDAPERRHGVSGADGSRRRGGIGRLTQGARSAFGHFSYCIVTVAYHRFQSSSSPGRASPHDGSARVRCGFK